MGSYREKKVFQIFIEPCNYSECNGNIPDRAGEVEDLLRSGTLKVIKQKLLRMDPKIEPVSFFIIIYNYYTGRMV